MTVLTTIPNGASNKDIRDTINQLLTDVAALTAGGGGTPAPTFTAAPSIDSTPRAGQAISAISVTDGVVSNGAITTRSILLAGSAVASSYVLQAGDVGKQLIYRNTATGAGGSASANSVGVTVAVAAAAFSRQLAASGDSRMVNPAHPVNAYCDANPSVTNDRSKLQSGKTLGVPAHMGVAKSTTDYNSVYQDLPDLIAMKAKVYYLSAGYANDIVNGVAAADIIAAMQDISDRLHAAVPGCLVIWDDGVRLSETYAPGYGAKWAQVNAGLWAMLGSHVDAIVPISRNPILSYPGAGDDNLLFQLNPENSFQHSGNRPLFYNNHQAAAFPVLDACLQDKTGDTPDQFTFQDQTNVELSTVYTAGIYLAGMGPSRSCTVTGDGNFSVGQSGFDANPKAPAYLGDLVRAQLTSSASNNTATSRLVTAGGVSNTFDIVTKPQASQAVAAIAAPASYSSSDTFNQAFPDLRIGGGAQRDEPCRVLIWASRNGNEDVGQVFCTLNVGGQDYACTQVSSRLWVTNSAAVPASSTGKITVSGGYNSECTMSYACLTSATNVGAASSLPQATRNDGNYPGDTSITVATGGLIIAFTNQRDTDPVISVQGATRLAAYPATIDGAPGLVAIYVLTASGKPTAVLPAFMNATSMWAVEVHP